MDLCQCDITILNYLRGLGGCVSITVDGVPVSLSWGWSDFHPNWFCDKIIPI